MLRIEWKESLMKLEESHLIKCNQYGSRKAKSSLNPAQVETLQLDHSRITRRDCGQINYGARACYDRILPNIEAIANRAHGLPESIFKLHFDLLKNMKNMLYKKQIKSGFRPVQFKNEPDNLVFGTVQRSGNRPTKWTSISNILLKSMESQAMVACYCNHKEPEVEFKSTDIVDNVNTHQTALRKSPLTKLHQKLPSPSLWTAWTKVMQSFTLPTRCHLKEQLVAWLIDQS